jgi:hypothetical protein
MNDFITEMLKEINKLPSIMKYPILLQMCQALFQELDNAEKEYIEEKNRMVLSLLTIAKNKNFEINGEE